MKSIHNTAWAYTKGAASLLAMAIGTAVLMAALSGTVTPRTEVGDAAQASKLKAPAGDSTLIERKTASSSNRN